MFKITSKYFLSVLIITLLSKPTIAITGKDISKKVSDWLVSEGIDGKPVFSNSSVYKDCNNNLEIKKIYNNYRTVKVYCSDKQGYQLLIRVKILNKKAFVRNNPNYLYSGKSLYLPSINEIKNLIIKKSKNKENTEKNNSSITSQIYFFGG